MGSNGPIGREDEIIIQALEYEMKQVLEALADVFERPDITNYWANNESTIGDFLPAKFFKSPEKDRKIIGRYITERLTSRLGVPIKLEDHIYEIAIRIRDN